MTIVPSHICGPLRLAASVIAATFALAGVGVGAASAQSASNTTKIQPCVGHAVTKPKSYVIACADANIQIRSMRWRSWSNSEALGTGIYEFNTCTPTCVAGTFVNDAATVTLTRAERGDTARVFSKMTVQYRVSKSKAKTVSYSLPLKGF